MTERDDYNTSIPQAALQAGKSAGQMYRLAQLGKIRVLLKGGRWFVSDGSLAAYIDMQREPIPPQVA